MYLLGNEWSTTQILDIEFPSSFRFRTEMVQHLSWMFSFFVLLVCLFVCIRNLHDKMAWLLFIVCCHAFPTQPLANHEPWLTFNMHKNETTPEDTQINQMSRNVMKEMLCCPTTAHFWQLFFFFFFFFPGYNGLFTTFHKNTIK